jgi:hypothetical protein
MALNDLNKDDLLQLASEHEIEGRSKMSKEELVSALEDLDVVGGTSTVTGFQQGVAYPTMPKTPAQFAQLLENPSLPAENQSAPSPEKLNPHIFPTRLP